MYMSRLTYPLGCGWGVGVGRVGEGEGDGVMLGSMRRSVPAVVGVVRWGVGS